MAMRITTNGVFRGYRGDLNNSFAKMQKSMTRVTTQRNFGSYAEDVSAASRAFQLRRSHWRTDTQVNNSNYVVSKFETAWSAIDYIVDGEGSEDNLNGIVESLRGLNSPTGSARVTLGESITAKAESIVRLMNSQYGDQFIFAGADARNVPFTWELDGSDTYLAYRGIDVSTPVGMSEEEFYSHVSWVEGDPDNAPGVYTLTFDKTLTDQGFAPPEPAITLTAQSVDPDGSNPVFGETELEAALTKAFNEYKTQFDDKYASFVHGEEGASAYENGRKLVEMSQEATYVDIGLGMDWDENGDLIPSSAYNAALNGLSFLGFGSTVGEDGELHSNNLAVLMKEMGAMLKSCDPKTGDYPAGWDSDRASSLTKAIERSVNDVTVQHIRLSNETNYLETNLLQLTAQRDTLNTQILDIEQVDPAGAITEYMYARYAYNAALSVGSSILTNTLLDYLR